MLIPVERDLTLYPGLQFNPLLEFFTDLGRTQPFDLTGYSAEFHLGNGLLVLSVGSGLTLGGAAGTVQVFATAAQTTPIPLGELPWFLEWTPSGGQPDCPASGTVKVQTP